ncbi:MAG: ribonucleotide reductase subunit alpha [Cytophagales bacterium]|nr:ribonucleotide reductase subunit alpha [Rhizobacter sp.]
MSLDSFDDLLNAARQQAQPQRLLFVFTGAELPGDASPSQRTAFDSGQGGALAPLMCADKTPEELQGFEALVSESEQFGQAWAIVFVAGLSGKGGVAPTSAQAEAPLQTMVESIKAGKIATYVPFNREGQPVNLR